MGERRRIESIVSRLLFQTIRVSGVRFVLRGVGLSHPKFEFEKNLKLFNKICEFKPNMCCIHAYCILLLYW
jgi:hypothetical protein